MDEENDASGTLDNASSQLNNLTLLSRQFEKVVIAAFKNGATHVKSFETALRGAAMQLSTMVLKNAFKGLFGDGGGLAKILSGNLNDGGGAAAEPQIEGFAQGGVFASPRYFPVNNGLGVLGEAGPEAVMPLTRGSDGRLGVRASGGGEPSINVQISTPDAPSFLRSEAQVSAALARAVARGRRGL